jgi:hypothetical protein
LFEVSLIELAEAYSLPSVLMHSAPKPSDALQWGYSLANVSEIMEPCLDAAGTRSLLEIGSFRGELTERLLGWAEGSGAAIATVEPLPPDDLRELAKRHPELTLVEDTGVGALQSLGSLPDAIVIDGDHTYYTLTSELETIAARAGDDRLPLLFFHDVGWPHERRDTYYAPDRVPEDSRQPLAHNCTLQPGNPGVSDGGLPYEWAAAKEGGARNGVLTAIEDFMAGREGLQLAVVPVFFGFGVLWETGANWSAQVERILAPYDRHPVLERAEANRVAHLVRGHVDAKEIRELKQQIAERDEILGRMLQSSALGLAERLSKLRQRGNPIFTRAEIRGLLDRRP